MIEENRKDFSFISPSGLGAHSPSIDPTTSPSNNNSLPVTPIPSNNSMTRSQEGNEQTSNPFDVIIKKTKFPGTIKD